MERQPHSARQFQAGWAELGTKAPKVRPADPTDEILAKWGVKDRASELRERRSETDMLGRTHTRYRQMYKGVEVDDRELIVHTKNGAVYEVNGDFLAGLSLSVEPKTSVDGGTLVVWCEGPTANDARLAWRVPFTRGSLPYVRFVDAATGEELETRRTNSSHFTAAKADVKESNVRGRDDDDDDEDDDEVPLFIVANGVELKMYGITNAFPNGASCTFKSRMPNQQGAAEVEITGTLDSEDNFYFAATNKYGVEYCIYEGLAAPQWTNEVVRQVAANNRDWFENFYTNATFTSFKVGEAESLPMLADAVAISHNLQLVMDFYMEVFGRNSYDDEGGRVVAWRFWPGSPEALQYGYANAFWSNADTDDGERIGCFYFGYDYKGIRSETSLDSCAHELTHGVTAFTAELQYKGESGALNESFSDLIGVACEFACHPKAADMEKPRPSEADWLFDEDARGSDPDDPEYPNGECVACLRSYANPTNTTPQPTPSRYCGTCWIDTNLDADNGGVHINSGVQNHFFYLLCEGAKGWNGEKELVNDGVPYEDFNGIGMEKARKMAYLALTSYCRPRTNYREVRQCWMSAAMDLCEAGEIDEADMEVVRRAWAAVMPFTSMSVSVAGDGGDGFVAGDEVAVIGMLDWDTNVTHTVGEGNCITVDVPVNLKAGKAFRVTDCAGKSKLFLIARGNEGEPDVIDISARLPDSPPTFQVTEVELDNEDGEVRLALEFGGEGDSEIPLVDMRVADMHVSDFLRLRGCSDLSFDAEKSMEIDVSKVKLPYTDEETEEQVPNKYNLILDIPRGSEGGFSPSGFYKLEW